MYMIVGLGNPGKEYALTKHNVGFWVIDKIAEEMNIDVEKKQCQALTGTGFWEGKKVLLVKPQTYMNLSGQAVIQLLNYYNDKIDDIIVIHDDLDLEPGMIRFKQGGGAGGHNGIKSIASHLNSNDFDRLKLGIGRGIFIAALGVGILLRQHADAAGDDVRERLVERHGPGPVLHAHDNAGEAAFVLAAHDDLRHEDAEEHAERGRGGQHPDRPRIIRRDIRH